eukprot:TRINITY_DN1942_c0_g1_i1.p1 TRINITY_DN1942_c0_g1~~TRINITY_DN1942_c0_g1_i1.p1  ORF type:complete len:359 (+),score=59.44 TRINITY_DN1942_c0_g1_i1:77-1153(+)
MLLTTCRKGSKWIRVGRMRHCSSISKTIDTSPVTDSYGRLHNYLRISLTERCNLRCTYCMPEKGVDLTPQDQLLTNEEIFRIVNVFAQCGVDKVRLTGGEPSIRKDIVNIVHEIAQVDGIKTVGMTSNGIALHRKLEDLKQSGLNALNLSLDTLDKDKFAQISRRNGLPLVLKSINKALDLGYNPVKINCVVTKGFNDNEILDFVAWTKDYPIQVRFIEYMPFDGNIWTDENFLSYGDMIKIIKQNFDLKQLPLENNHTSKDYYVPGFKGSVGFISSMSNQFCGSCNRLRLLADGSLKLCLFGRKEYSIRDHIRNGATNQELKEFILSSVQNKKPSHDGMYNIEKKKGLNRPMIKIGG